MQYRYAPNRNYQDFASGRVFYAQPGQPAFPVRVASEIFQRALAHWRTAGGQGRVTLYDPVCGGAYWLAVLGTLHREEIAAIYASDIDPDVLALAAKNLSLLTLAGLDRRIAEIETMLADYGKASHAEALASARQLRQLLFRHSEQREESRINHEEIEQQLITTRVFQADATDPASLRRGLPAVQIDLVLADVPYGWHSTWVAAGDRDQPPVAQLLAALQSTLKPGAVVAVAADKSQKIRHENYIRIEKFQVGRRRIEILQMKRAE